MSPWVTWRRNRSDGSVIGCKSLIFRGLGGVVGRNGLGHGWLGAKNVLQLFTEKIHFYLNERY